MGMHKKAAGGFTLLEVIAVVLILGIMGGVAVMKYVDHSERARQSAEAAVVSAVKSGLHMYRMNAAASGLSVQWPSVLDSAGADARASAGAPFFRVVLDAPVTSGWSKTSDLNEYVSPQGNVYLYMPETGLFGTKTEVTASALGAQDGLGGGGGGSGAGSGSAPAPVVYVPSAMYTAMSQWRAGVDALSGYIGTGYTMNSNGEVMLTDSAGFTESARRVTMVGHELTGAGTYTLELDTELTNYWNQLNYWKVIGVKNGTTLNLSGNSLNWDYTQPGTKTLFKDYAPPDKSNGSWYSYSGTFTISEQDAAEYDQIVVVMAGTKYQSQILGWRNVKLTGP